LLELSQSIRNAKKDTDVGAKVLVDLTIGRTISGYAQTLNRILAWTSRSGDYKTTAVAKEDDHRGESV